MSLRLLFLIRIFFICNFICLFLALLDLHCYMGFSLVVASRGRSPVEVRGLLVVVVSLVAEYGLSARRLQQLQHGASVVVANRLSSRKACGIFLDQGSNPGLPQWQEDSTTEPPEKLSLESLNLKMTLEKIGNSPKNAITVFKVWNEELQEMIK